MRMPRLHVSRRAESVRPMPKYFKLKISCMKFFRTTSGGARLARGVGRPQTAGGATRDVEERGARRKGRQGGPGLRHPAVREKKLARLEQARLEQARLEQARLEKARPEEDRRGASACAQTTERGRDGLPCQLPMGRRSQQRGGGDGGRWTAGARIAETARYP